MRCKFWVVLLSLLACSHIAPLGTTKSRVIDTNFSSDIKWTHDQVLMCVFLEGPSLLKCMSPEEFQFRANLGEPEDPVTKPEDDALPPCADLEDGGTQCQNR